MLISVIVPIYNVESFLPECIESILNQSYDEIEVILVDDGSSDNSSQICDRYAGLDSRIQVIHKNNEGLVLARHDGAIRAKGEYLTFVDGDDFLLPERIQSFANGICEYGKVDIVCADLSYYPNVKRTICNTIKSGLYQGEKKNNLLDVFLSSSPFFNFGITPNLVSKCIRSEFYCNHDQIPSTITLGEDLAVTYNLVLNADSICVVQNADYMYRYNELSISHKHDDYLVDKINNLLVHLRRNMVFSSTKLESQINDYHCMLLKNVVFNHFLYDNKKFKYAKANLRNDLILLDYKNVINKVNFLSVKDKTIYWLLKNDCFILLYLIIKVKKKRNKNI